MKQRIAYFWIIVFATIIIGCAAPSTATSTTATTTTATTTTTTTTTTTITTTTTTTTTTTITTEAMEPGHYRLSELQADYDQFVRYLAFNPQIFTDKDELAQVIVSQRELLRHGMTKLEFFRVLTVVMATVRCGHSFVMVPPSVIDEVFDNDLAYPIDVRLIDGRLFVIGIDGETELNFGDEIVMIDQRNVSDVTSDMMRSLSADGEGTAYKTRVLGQYYFSYYQLYLATEETIEIEYIDSDTHLQTQASLTRNCPNVHGWVMDALFEASWEEDVAVMTLRSFYPESPVTLADFDTFFEDFFQTVETQGIHKMILDIRGNGGGDPRVASRLLSYLADEAIPYFAPQAPDYYPGLKNPISLSEHRFDGELVVLIDAYCFSTCGHFAALLQYHQIGTLIGEETGGGYTCSDSSVTLTLSYTQLRMNTSMTEWTVATEGLTKGRGSSPDLEVSMRLDDYRDGIDRVYETALEWLRGQNQP